MQLIPSASDSAMMLSTCASTASRFWSAINGMMVAAATALVCFADTCRCSADMRAANRPTVTPNVRPNRSSPTITNTSTRGPRLVRENNGIRLELRT